MGENDDGVKADSLGMVSAALFARRPRVGDMELHPLSAGRLVVLEERRNPIAIGAAAGDEVSSWAVFEVMMVAVMSDDDLVDASLLDPDAWQREVRRFGLGIPDETLKEFWAILEADMDAIARAKTKPKKKARGRK